MEKRQRFTAEFKREAVGLLKHSGKPVATIARELGVPRNRLYKWVADAEKLGAEAFPGGGRRADDEVTKLRREVERLKEENEILKKAAVYFAKELP
jgi:transposase